MLQECCDPEKYEAIALEEGVQQERLRKQWSHSALSDILTSTRILTIHFPLFIHSHRKYFFIVYVLGSVLDASSIPG